MSKHSNRRAPSPTYCLVPRAATRQRLTLHLSGEVTPLPSARRFSLPEAQLSPASTDVVACALAEGRQVTTTFSRAVQPLEPHASASSSLGRVHVQSEFSTESDVHTLQWIARLQAGAAAARAKRDQEASLSSDPRGSNLPSLLRFAGAPPQHQQPASASPPQRCLVSLKIVRRLASSKALRVWRAWSRCVAELAKAEVALKQGLISVARRMVLNQTCGANALLQQVLHVRQRPLGARKALGFRTLSSREGTGKLRTQ